MQPHEASKQAPMALLRESPTWLGQVLLIAKKDLKIELRTGEIIVTGGFFAVLVTVMSSLAYYSGPHTRNQVSAGVIWLATAFAAVLSLSRTWQRERDEGALDGLMVSPIRPSAIFCGKAIGITAFLLTIESIVIPSCTLFFSLDILDYAVGLCVLMLVATPGIAASGTLFGVMTVRTRARDLVLSIVLFPLLSPTLLAAVVATRELFAGVPITELGDYLAIMGLFDALFIVGGLTLFGSLAEQ